MTHDPTSPPPARSANDVLWLITQFVDEVPGVTYALVVSLDGLQLAASNGFDRDVADQLAALTAGLLSLADRGGELFRLGHSEHLNIRFPHGHLLFMRIGDSAGLAVVAALGSDLRVLAYQMTQFVHGVGHVLTPDVRTSLHRRTFAAAPAN